MTIFGDDLYCPSCNSRQVMWVGKIPSSIYFAGAKVQAPIKGGSLFSCKSCSLYFRFPRLSKSELENSYSQIDESPRWQHHFAERLDWKIAANWIDERLGKRCRVLDVGCNDGEFLSAISGGHLRYGIELNESASKRAVSNGVTIIGSEFEKAILNTPLNFDVITAFDVIEHVGDPLNFLRLLEKKLSPGGEIYISSGNTESWAWRFMGSKYWYCSPPEHIVFINPKWARIAATKIDTPLVNVISFSRNPNHLNRQLLDALKNIIFKLLPIIFAWKRGGSFSRSEIEDLSPPAWGSTKDHIILRFSK